MDFTHDTKLALLAGAALVNTTADSAASGHDELRSPEDVERFLTEHPYSGSRTYDDAEMQALRAVRPRLRRLWTSDVASAVSIVNELLREHAALPQLVRHDEWDWHIHAVGMDRPLSERVAVEVALAVVDLIRAEELQRLRACEAADCQAVLVDLSRNRSKRYCDVGNCGNRANVAAYRARRAARASEAR